LERGSEKLPTSFSQDDKKKLSKKYQNNVANILYDQILLQFLKTVSVSMGCRRIFQEWVGSNFWTFKWYIFRDVWNSTNLIDSLPV